MAKTNAFEDLLASIGSESDRKALAEIAERVPEVRNGYLRQSDYSRSQDELKAEKEKLAGRVKLADEWDAWVKDNYVFNAYGEGKGATKREIQKDNLLADLNKTVEELQKQVELGGDMDFAEVSKFVSAELAKAGVARQEDVTKLVNEKASGVEQTLLGYAHLATVGPTLAIRHYKTYQEELPLDQLVEFANKNGHNDLNRAYDAYTVDKREAARKAEIDAQIKEATEKARKEERERLAAERGSMSLPTDDGSPEMGHLERKMLGLDKAKEGEGHDGIPFGKGGLAAIAARDKEL